MNGPPQKPTTACSGFSSRRTARIASRTGPTVSAGSGMRSASTAARVRIGSRTTGPTPFDELDVDAHRDDRGHDVREHHRRVDAVAANRLERDLGGQLGGAVDLEERVPLADLAVLGQRPPGLPHEPDRGALDRLAPRGAHEERFHTL